MGDKNTRPVPLKVNPAHFEQQSKISARPHGRKPLFSPTYAFVIEMTEGGALPHGAVVSPLASILNGCFNMLVCWQRNTGGPMY